MTPGPLSILLVAQLAPPSPLIAARRVAGLTKYLARLGYRVIVLTSAVSGNGPIDGAAAVHRTGDLLATRLNWRRDHLEALRGERAASSYARPSALEALVVPDLALVGWVPAALRRAVAVARSDQVDCVVTTSPPQSAHLIGRALQRRGIPWIAELRDGWTFEPPREQFPLAVQRTADAALEARMLRRADAVVAVTDPIAADLRERLAIEAEVITNGFDPEERPADVADGLLAPDRHSFVHTGRMAVSRSTPRPLLDALRLLRARSPETARRLEVVFAGPLSADEKRLVEASGLNGIVRAVGAVPRERALALQRAADTLLVVTEGSTRRSVATGKLFEYLGSGRPILVLGDDTEAARIVRDAGAGIATSATDSGAIADALRHLAETPLAAGARADAAARYAYPAIAARFAQTIERVTG